MKSREGGYIAEGGRKGKKSDGGIRSLSWTSISEIPSSLPWTARLIIVLEGLKEVGVSSAELPLSQMHLTTTLCMYTHTPVAVTQGARVLLRARMRGADSCKT